MSADIHQLDVVDQNNVLIWGAEGAIRVKGLNDAGRSDEGLLARWFVDWNNSHDLGGGPTAYTVASQTKPGAYYEGFTICARVNVNCAADATLNVDSIGAAPILRTDGSGLAADDLVADSVHSFAYRGGAWYAKTVPGLGTAAYVDTGTAEGEVPVLNADRTLDWEQQGAIGELRMYGGADTPATWAEANGQALSRTGYAALFAIYGTTFGAGNGSTTFNLPDMEDVAARGPSATNPLGTAHGEATVALTAAQNGPHQHSGGQVGTNQPNNTSPGSCLAIAGSGGSYTLPNTGSSGSGNPHNNVGPSLAIRFLVKTGYPAS